MTATPFLKPTPDQIREALQRYVPQLADQPIEPLGEGWAMWVFRVGDHVLRFPQNDWAAREFDLNRSLLPELAQHVSLPLPVPDLYGEHGPNGMPFTGHRLIPGVSLISAAALLAASARGGSPDTTPGASFGRELGAFLRELHSFPADRAAALGVPVLDGPAFRATRIEFYEEIVRQTFPLISCEARSYTQERFETYLNNPANFAFEPRLIHHDLDRQNVLVNPATGHLTGVIDFGGGTKVSKPAIDLWLPLVDFAQLGIAGQLPDFLDAYNDPDLDLERAQIEADFIQFLWPFHDIQFGLSRDDPSFVEDGIRALNASLPPQLKCP